MKRALFIMVLGLAGAAATYAIVYFAGTATPRSLLNSPQPELAWLRHEFNLGESEFQRIAGLHAEYLPQCLDRCRRIEELNRQFDEVLARSETVTSELADLLEERAQMRMLCEKEMLEHFFAVSQSMPPEQGRRYLEWARAHTGLNDGTMDHHELDPVESSVHH